MLMFLLMVFFMGCKKESTPGPNEVWMQNNSFNPSSITIAQGATVKWINKDNATHNVVSGSAFSSGDIVGGASYSRTFTSTGTFQYVCTYHMGMGGSVVVAMN
jgi:plastocyanin